MSDLSRRELLRAGLTAAGALFIETWLPGCGTKGPRMVSATGQFVPNAWIRVAPDDVVTLVLDRVEMGQGTMTSHATIVAEELEVDPARIVVEFAPAERAYDNPDADLGFQITGGSSSVRTSFEPLRKAAATTRDMLRRAAARRFGVPVEQCQAASGVVTHAPSGRKLRYGELVADAAREEPLAGKTKAPSEFRFIGKAVGRKDARAKVDGSAVFGIDVKLPGLLTAVILRPPRLGAKAESFDAKAALADEGVVQVGEVAAGVFVVATSYWRARAAAAKVKVTWSAGRDVSSDRLKREYLARAAKGAKVVRDVGSWPPRGGANLRAVYEAPYLAHATMEPQNATARLVDGKWEVWAPTQAPGLARQLVADLTGAILDDITIHQTFVGGGFGRRLQQDYVLEAVSVSRAIGGRPVKVVWSREDDTRHDAYRPMTMNVLEASFDGGALTGWFHRAVSQSIVSQIGREWGRAIPPNGAPAALKAMVARSVVSLYRSRGMEDKTSHEGASDFAYAIPNLRVEHAQVDPDVPVGFWRGVGFSENVFIVESFVDEIAHAMKKDPLELRRTLLAKAPKHLRVLDLAAEKAGWRSPPPAGVFRGIAQCRAFETYAAQVAEVSVTHGKIRVHRIVCAIDCGLVVNPDIVRAQVEGAVAFGLSAALKQKITYAGGAVEQSNFHDFELLRLNEMPVVEVHLVPSEEPPTGIGEPGLPPVAPAVANAIFAATGKRLRTLPLERSLEES